jgi:hypothetical protein
LPAKKSFLAGERKKKDHKRTNRET